jgi:hypothetical protein
MEDCPKDQILSTHFILMFLERSCFSDYFIKFNIINIEVEGKIHNMKIETIPWSRVAFDKLIVTQLAKKFPKFLRTGSSLPSCSLRSDTEKHLEPLNSARTLFTRF